MPSSKLYCSYTAHGPECYKAYEAELQKNLLSHIVRRGKTIDESLRNITLKDGICFLANAWNALNESSIRSSFQKLFNKSSDWDNEDVIPLSELRLQLAEDAFNIQSIATLLQEVEPLQQISHSEIEQWIVEPMMTLLMLKKPVTWYSIRSKLHRRRLYQRSIFA